MQLQNLQQRDTSYCTIFERIKYRVAQCVTIWDLHRLQESGVFYVCTKANRETDALIASSVQVQLYY